MSVNKVILVGNVGKDPEVRYLDNGIAVAKLPLATSESYKGKDGNKVEKTEWHNLVFWRGLAEVVEKWIKKGSLIYIEGSIKTTMSEKDGQKRYFTEIVVRDMQMLGGKKEENTSQQPKTETKQQENIPEGESDLPF